MGACMLLVIFKALLAAHIAVGVVGLVAFWGPVLTRKGTPRHRRWGFAFAYAMIITGVLAIGIASTSLLEPLTTHPDFTDERVARALFGWMMLFLATFTVSLGYHTLATIRHKAQHVRLREPIGIFLQCAVITAAVNCAYQGVQVGQPLMMALPVVGIAAGVTSLHFIFNPAPSPVDYLMEHVKSGIGAGISAYNAFLSVGLVRLAPDHAFNPVVWAAPIVVGVGLIVFHWQRIWFRRLHQAVRG